MNQQWRRNIKKAAKSGVVVIVGEPSDLPAFHRLYAETAVRDGFAPRPLGVLPPDVRCPARGGSRPDPALPGTPRAGSRRRHDLGAGRCAYLVLLRRVIDRQARGAGVERDPVADDSGRARGGGGRLRPARDHRHPRQLRPAHRAHPVQGGNGRGGGGVRRRVGSAAVATALQGVRPLHGVDAEPCRSSCGWLATAWRTHLRAVAEAHPGIVPVVKGNGYGLGLPDSLARPAGWARRRRPSAPMPRSPRWARGSRATCWCCRPGGRGSSGACTTTASSTPWAGSRTCRRWRTGMTGHGSSWNA